MKKEVLAIIPARGNSKGIPRKNIKLFNGKPLIEWSIDCAIKSKIFSNIIVSTEDSEIAEISDTLGAEVPFIRPEYLSRDSTSTASVVQHTLAFIEATYDITYKYVFIIEPTSPLRQPVHLKEAYELLLKTNADTVAGTSKVPHHYNPEKILNYNDGVISGINNQHVSKMIHQRQLLKNYMAFNGLVWGCKTEVLLSTPPTIWGKDIVGYIIPDIYSVDLDEPEDWEPAEHKMKYIEQLESNWY